ESGRMTLGALEVPRLLAARPVEQVPGPERLARVEVEPALPTLVPGPRVPGEAERLEAPVRKSDEVLLERIHAERVGDLEVCEVPVGTIGAHQELAVAAREGRSDAVLCGPRLVEVTEDRLLRGRLHGAIVVGAAEGLRLLRVTAGALRAADEGGRGSR